MTRQILNRGSTANDGTGDTLRQAALKIEQNFQELYEKLGGDSTVLMPLIGFDSDGVLFEGTTNDGIKTKLFAEDPSSNRFLELPNYTGQIVVDSATQTLANKTLNSPVLVTPQLRDSSGNYEYLITPGGLSADQIVRTPTITDSDELTFNKATQTLTAKTLQQPLLNSPKIGALLADSNGNEFFEFSSTPGAINHIAVNNNTNGNTPALTAAGGDTNIDLGLSGKGDGGVEIQSKLKLSFQNLTANGAIDLTKPLTFFNSGTSLAATMANGTEKGETKYLVNQNSGTATITPTSLQNYSTITLTVDESCTLVWGGTAWVVLNVGGDSSGGILA